MATIKKRHSARTHAFQFLYRLQLEDFASTREELSESLQKKGDPQILEMFVAEFDSLFLSEELPEDEYRQFFIDDIICTLKHYDELLDLIKDHSDSWNKTRNNSVDLTILLMSLAEIRYLKTPANVVMNEAIELAKKFSRKESPGLVNGILDKIVNLL